MTWGFPGPQAAKGRPVTNVRNLASPFWRSALGNLERRCIVPVTRFCEWSAEPDPATRRKVKHWFGMHEAHDPMFAFAGLFLNKEGAFAPDYEDEILKAALVTQGGAVVHPSLKS